MYKYIKLSLFALIMTGIVMSCEEDTYDPIVDKDGPTVINYIRLTDPNRSDSLLTGAFMGSLITIVGDNFGGLKELWFNDQKSVLQPNFITDKTIIVNVPSTVPTEVTNKIRMVFSDGTEYLYDFKVNVPAPIITGIKSEYVATGDVVELSGDFFFDPKVTFAGDAVGTVVSAEKTLLKIAVPEGAQPGPIVVSNNFGKATSRFLFRDDRNTIINFDDKQHVNWTAPTFDGTNRGITPVAGKYAMFSDAEFGEWKWNNPTTLWFFAPERGAGPKPLAVGPVSDLAVKFEVNVPEAWEDFALMIFMSKYDNNHGYDDGSFARWMPWRSGPFKTTGWQTVTIPLSAFQYHKDDSWDRNDKDKAGSKPLTSLDGLTNINMMMFGPNFVLPSGTKTNIQIGIDNIRIVPIN